MSIKSEVLNFLENNIGTTLSGEDLANKLSVTRNSIWKAINSLRNDGYKISAIPNKGYCLLQNNDVISEIGLRKYLSTNFTGDIYTFKTIDSTNKFAKKLALDAPKAFTLIVAEEQSSGKGRLGRSFFSPAESGIYMSLILKPNLSINDAVLITTATSVAVCRAIKATTKIDTQIKWVNDILIHNKKVGGILTEAVTNFETGNIDYIILGIGINFISPQAGFPTDIESIATSLFKKGQNTLTRNELIAEITNEITKILPQIQDRNFINEYKERSIVLGKEIKYYINGIEYYGTVTEINNDGALNILNSTGDSLVINSGEITIRTL